MREIKKIAILTSGGDAPGMNAVVRAVTRYALSRGIEVYGIYEGYQGLINGEGYIKRFGPGDVANIVNVGGTMLYSARCLSFKEEEGMQKAIANARAQLKQAQSNLAIARKNLDDSTTVAPFDCVVFDKYVEENEFVSAGQNILRLENQNSLEVICFISAVYYDRINAGKTPVDFTDRNGKMIARSVITYKAPGIDPESRTFKIKISVPAKTGLVSGMLCELDIILAEREGYGLPESAVLLRAENRMIAYTADEGSRARSVEIKRGIVDSGFCEILNAGDILDKRFVVTGQTFINNGSLLVDANAGKK